MALGYSGMSSVMDDDQYGMGQVPLSYGLQGFGAAPPASATLAPTVPVPPGVGMTMAPPGGGIQSGMFNMPPGAPQTMNPTQAANLAQWQDRTQIGKMFNNQDGTFNWGAVGSAAQAIGGLGQLYLGFQANKQAKEQFQYMKSVTERNMSNQIKDFNKAVEDQARTRGVQNNADPSVAKEYVKKHSL